MIPILNPSLDVHWASRWPSLLLLAALPWIIYGWSINADFFFLDDRGLFWLANPLVANGDLKGAWLVWCGRHQGYTPLTHFTVWMDHALDFHRHPWVVRGHSLLWASFLALGLRSVLAQWTKRPLFAFILTALFIIHPLCAPSMLWPAMRRKLLFLAWTAWSLSWFIRAWTTMNGRAAWGWSMLGVLGSGLALAGNFHAVILTPLTVMLAATHWHTTRHRSVLLAGIIGAGCLGLAFIVLEWLNLSGPPIHGHRLGGGGLFGTMMADGPILRDYLWHMVWPWRLTYYYGVNESGAVDIINVLSWGMVIATVAMTTWLHAQPRRAAALWLAALICILPVINLINFPFAAADHYVQPALVPIMVLMAELLQPRIEYINTIIAARWGWQNWTAALFSCYLLLASLLRVPTFTDGYVAAKWAMRIQPNSAIHPGYFVGTTIGRQVPPALVDQVGPTACSVFQKADVFRVPNTLLVHIGLAAINYLAEQGRLEDSERLWFELEKRHPDPTITQALRGVSAYAMGKNADSRRLLHPLLPLSRDQIEIIWKRCDNGKKLPKITAGAFNDPTNILGETPNKNIDRESTLLNQQLMYILAHACAADEQFEEAAKLMTACLAINPRFFPAWSLLAECQAIRGEINSAGLATKRYLDLMDQRNREMKGTNEALLQDSYMESYRPRRFIPNATATSAAMAKPVVIAPKSEPPKPPP